MAKVIAVVVTFNRKELLQRCLSALEAQTRPCDAIIVVDNASTDGTAHWLGENHREGTEAYGLSRNIGGAGGFNFGLRTAFQASADFIWVMDDDVICEPDALERLLEADRALEERGVERAFLASTIWTPEGMATNVPEIDRRPNRIDYENWTACLDLTAAPVTRATFVSILFPRRALEEHGLPLAPMFIWADDTEYTIRVTRRIPGFVVGASRVTHVRAMAGNISLLTEDNPVRIGFHRLLARNMVYVVRTHFGRKALLRHLRKEARTILKLLRAGQAGKARVLAGGIAEGLRFRPPVERADSSPRSLGVEITRIGKAERETQAA
ncbi:glycosyltransferase family 2 protein [Aureimonas populi]|uniref:Glycosyltransferase family 2 protein n=1 Tax=Aureimonas populi TaxID=1701758 RepID=A0ABW5CNE1_9HYPH|nr:glycosyltransferase family 2 protein [Aureimonas populi]